ncbi:hypothetical protein RR49_00368 [Microbacterium ginsengisoli]|jgi:hypothetical protein|uniref:Uncharacterized protein n=1 Tax=Microbacterium ginsengisoli TaxID=400772 RepID=A0A0F0M0C9_9MICO|nr:MULTISPECIES: hypothetical protein [Micrococcales]KJL40865.1 hypothetical protein RR49_00368 [Microbacterium ginsengisoli]MEA1265125.1 hypothetical protein [Microbacterium sp. STF-2]MEE2524347.1 hypothetical protein [Pseudarthrobacter sp. J47]
MTTVLQAVEPPEPDPVADAIAALTTAARQTRVRGAGTEHAAVEPVDFGEIACHVITTVAANLGGVDELLAGRPGSWEADYVRQIVQSTAGDDPDELLRYRTEPVRLAFDAADVFYDLGLSDLYEQATAELGSREDALDEELFNAVATPEERARIADIQAAMPADVFGVDEQDRDRVLALMQEAQSITGAVIERAESTGEPQAAALASARAATATVEELWQQDLAAYTAAYLAAARRYFTDRGVTCEVELTTTPTGEPATWDTLTDQVHEYARTNAPLPMTGEAPDYSDGSPADALRRAGLTYIDRARQA